MKRNTILVIAASLLVPLGIYLIYPGTKGNNWPPIITGIGFMIIAAAFLALKGK